MLTPGDFEWVLSTVSQAGYQGADPRGFPESPGLGAPADPSDHRQRQLAAAWCLREIATAAIECLDRLPIDLQTIIAEHANSWPVMLRPKLTNSAKRAAFRVAEMRLARELPIVLEHSTASDSGEKVSVQESTWPGIGLAAHLYEILSELREHVDRDSAMTGCDPSLVCAIAPEMLADSLEDSFWNNLGIDESGKLETPEHEVSRVISTTKEEHKRKRLAFGRKIHLEFLIATLPALTSASVVHWKLAGLRHLQCSNDGFLVHDVTSDKSAAGTRERLSPLIPDKYWTATKLQAAKEGKKAVTLLESKVEKDLARGFGALAKTTGE